MEATSTDEEIIQAIDAWGHDPLAGYWEASELLCQIRDALQNRRKEDNLPTTMSTKLNPDIRHLYAVGFNYTDDTAAFYESFAYLNAQEADAFRALLNALAKADDICNEYVSPYAPPVPQEAADLADDLRSVFPYYDDRDEVGNSPQLIAVCDAFDALPTNPQQLPESPANDGSIAIPGGQP